VACALVEDEQVELAVKADAGPATTMSRELPAGLGRDGHTTVILVPQPEPR
jgi:hypothetical protein